VSNQRGIVSGGGYVPYRRLQRAEITRTFGSGGGKGARSVASYDEDTTTMGVEAARLALRAVPDGTRIDGLFFSTADPAYLDKTNATAIHAALRLDSECSALDLGGAPRSAVGALRVALEGAGTTLVVSSDLRTGLPTSPDESTGGDAAAALLVGDGASAPVIAEYLGSGTATEEFLDRWRTPGDRRS
jgi:hydroxymethylglutaryl-CoA synthase